MNVESFLKKAEARAHIKALANKQTPHTLFITCADSRIDPALITQTKPGELLVLRNVGNIIPPKGHDIHTDAAVEFATQKLNIQNIVIMGHTNCGALAKNPTPTIAKWVQLAGKDSKDNLLKQLEHLKSYPEVQGANISLWLFNLETASVQVYNEKTKSWDD
ncbi:MAG: Carbonic anhydrase 1 [Chlamydiales bacterium]|nr:Carbonic anhydrase 1 [Chlamydiales bacterium]MCH9635636.1 Carbonic anhydrase 1 [Chlamydiales bacterium]